MDLVGILFPKRCVNCKQFGDYLCPLCFSRLQFATPSSCFICNKFSTGGMTHKSCQGADTPDAVFFSLNENRLSNKLRTHFTTGPQLRDLQYVLSDLLYEGLIQQESFYSTLQKGSICLHYPSGRKDEDEAALLLTRTLAKRLNIPTVTKDTQLKENGMVKEIKQIYLICLRLPPKQEIAPIVASLRSNRIKKVFLLVLASDEFKRK